MNNPKISIIVPIYNAEKYLSRCIDSILAQTFTDFELLLIDDGSTDNSNKICDEYAKRNYRIKVFHKKNSGVSSARNVGLDNAIGEWICFSDSDDWMENNWLQSFMDFETENFIVEGYYYKKGNIHEIANRLICKKCNISESIEYLYKKQNIGLLWCRAFRRSIIEDFKIRFNEDFKIREDEDFILCYMQHIKTVQLSSIIAYHYNMPDLSKYKNCEIMASIECTNNIIASLFIILKEADYKNKLASEIDRLLIESIKLLIRGKKEGWYYLNMYKYYRKRSKTNPISLKPKILHLLQMLFTFFQKNNSNFI